MCEECDREYDGYEDERYDPEGALVDALRLLDPAERTAILDAIGSGTPICVGSWGVNGVKQSYTCVMGAALCNMASIPVEAFASCVVSYANGDEEQTVLIDEDSLNFIALQERFLSNAGRIDVPEAFDNFFGTDGEFTMPSVGGSANILNGRGRAKLAELVTTAS